MTSKHSDFDRWLDALVASTCSPREHYAEPHHWKLLEKRLFPQVKRQKERWRLLYISIASTAALFILLVGWGIYESMYPDMKTIATAAEIRTFMLPDSTWVTLNRYSSLTYPIQFTEKKRQVTLQGEGYFEVKKDAEKPFVVEAEEINVQVLGTHFNVEAYPNDEKLQATLLEGSVAVRIHDKGHTLVLKPDESAVYNRTAKALTHHTGRTSSEAADWLNGEIHFNNLPLKEIVRRLSNAFHTKIVVEDTALQEYRIRAHFTGKETLKEILSLLQKTEKWKYRNEDDTLYIYK